MQLWESRAEGIWGWGASVCIALSARDPHPPAELLWDPELLASSSPLGDILRAAVWGQTSPFYSPTGPPALGAARGLALPPASWLRAESFYTPMGCRASLLSKPGEDFFSPPPQKPHQYWWSSGGVHSSPSPRSCLQQRLFPAGPTFAANFS